MSLSVYVRVVGVDSLLLHLHVSMDTDICCWHVATYEEEIMVH